VRRYDYGLFVPAICLAFLGLVIVYSASATLAREKLGGETFFLLRHCVYLTVGLVGLVTFAHVPYAKLGKLSPLMVFAALGLLALVYIPGVGLTRGGATRWITAFGFTVQPAEAAKLALVIYLARYASRPERSREGGGPGAKPLETTTRDLSTFVEGWVKPGVVAAMLILPVLMQPDFGTSVILTTTFLLVLYAAGTRLVYPVGIVATLMPIAAYLMLSAEYRRRRLTAFIDPWNDMSNAGFQIIQSLLAFQGGGVVGRGLGEGRQKLFFLPEAHTDFVLSVVGEELGFIGVVFVLGCFAAIVWRGITIALHQGDPFGRLLAFGLTTLIGMQAAINGAVVLALLPTKGLTLPLVSYGGTSLMATLAAIGILMNVSSHTDFSAGPTARREATE